MKYEAEVNIIKNQMEALTELKLPVGDRSGNPNASVLYYFHILLHFSVAGDRNKVPICNFKILYDSRVCSNFAKKIRVVFFSHYRPKSTRDGSSDG